MYLAYFGLQDEPFRLTPDPRYLHFSEPHHAALKIFLEGILYGRGLIVITGPIGTGKTMLVHTALQILTELSTEERPMRTALLFNPTLNREEFLEAVLAEFEIRSVSSSKPSRLATLHQMLLDTQRRGGRAALIVDEAHLLSPELLEEVRLLGNADTHQEKLLQIVLCGQPELVTLLNCPALSALRQRIACHGRLRPLSESETRAYISERLQTAGLKASSPFPNETVESVYRFSQGVPRLINLICDSCLVLGFETERKIVQPNMVEEAAAALNLAAPATDLGRSLPDAGTAPNLSTVDLLIEAMKQGRAPAPEQNECADSLTRPFVHEK